MKILHLTLKKKWFEMISSREKTEEYREIKSHWISRLVDEIWQESEDRDYTFMSKGIGPFSMATAKHYDAVTFRNGYSKGAPAMTFKVDNITVGAGKHEWGAEPGKQYFIIKLGKKL